ncbi:MAG: ATP-binding cassette domain-containing protein [Nocardioidaceae bacterium]|nr:ATP-binding cassette domain-containing protein [Nocardioidaceae bacterium]
MTEPALRLDGVSKSFAVRGGARTDRVHAVRGVDLTVLPGQTVALVGESGSGKSTVARIAVRLAEPDAGTVTIAGRDVTHLRPRELGPLRRDVQMVFQDPYASLDPRMRVSSILLEPLRAHGQVEKGTAERRVAELLETVGLRAEDGDRYPHAFSGGQRQRIAIARALALRPRLLVLDEPVSALDVSVQAQILALLRSLQEQLGLAYLFITHDLHVAREVSQRIAVMHLGRVVEEGTAHQVFTDPVHPYTRALLSAAPVADPRSRGTRQRIVLSGDLPSVLEPPSGCGFRTRCWLARAECAVHDPALEPHRSHQAACLFPEELDATG